MALQIEYTDTFGGEANYCWVHRWWTKAELTDAQAIRLAKRLCEHVGERCRKENWGDTIALYPRGWCRVVFIGYAEDGYTQGVEVDARGEPVPEAAEA